jgi:hypothetical protein
MARLCVRSLALMLSLGFAFACSAQQPSLPVPPVAATAPQQTPVDAIRSMVVFIETDFKDGSETKHVVGTGFFVAMPETGLGENRSFVYLVTNRHVAQPGVDLGISYQVLSCLVRLNLVHSENGIESKVVPIPVGGPFQWHFPSDGAVDLAVMPLAPDHSLYAYQQLSDDLLATPEQVKSGDILVGDHVLFAGYFSSFPGQLRLEPILRQGVIAMMPDEDINTTLKKPGRVYLADLHAFHGNSGSPVFVNVGSTPHHGAMVLAEKYLLLGVLSGYYPESAGYTVPAATVLSGEVHDNSGIAVIVPAAELKKLLDSPELQAVRDSFIATRKKTQ